MATHFRDANLKLVRAEKHIFDLKFAITILKQTCTSTVEKHPETGIQELKHIVPNYEDAISELALIVGDAIHNLHTALDFAWHSTISIHAPRAISKSTKFPVRNSRPELKAALEGIKVDRDIPALFKVILDEFKAYAGGNDFLWTLHDLDISDKHIFLLEFSPQATVSEITVEDENGNVVTGSSMLIQTNPPYSFGFNPKWKLKNYGKLSLEVAFKEAGIFKGVQVLEMLRIFSIVASNIVHRLEKL